MPSELWKMPMPLNLFGHGQFINFIYDLVMASFIAR